jgi:HPr kinase/phosphorylase
MVGADTTGTLNMHASCVAYRGRGLLIVGASGSGKSALALTMIALGADLVADDRADVFVQNGAVFATAPTQLHGLIEERQVGILRLAAAANAQICAVVDLSETEQDRLPPLRHRDILGIPQNLFYKSHYQHFPAALMCYLAGTRAQ